MLYLVATYSTCNICADGGSHQPFLNTPSSRLRALRGSGFGDARDAACRCNGGGTLNSDAEALLLAIVESKLTIEVGSEIDKDEQKVAGFKAAKVETGGREV